VLWFPLVLMNFCLVSKLQYTYCYCICYKFIKENNTITNYIKINSTFMWSYFNLYRSTASRITNFSNISEIIFMIFYTSFIWWRKKPKNAIVQVLCIVVFVLAQLSWYWLLFCPVIINNYEIYFAIFMNQNHRTRFRK